jgi:hypothetical protein
MNATPHTDDSTAAAAPATIGTSVWATSASAPGTTSDALPAREAWRSILEAGLRAPSAENKHYLRFEVAADRVRLVSTDTATWAEQPHRRMLALLAYGAVIENMALRAASLGLRQHTRWWPEPALTAVIAECRWSPAAPDDDRLARAIPDRHTNRGFYRRTPVTAAALQRLSQAAQAVPGAGVLWLHEPGPRGTALRAIRRAETERFNRPALHRELFGAIDFSAGWTRSLQEGLSPGALAVEPPLRLPFAGLRHWPLMRGLTWLGMHHGLGLRAAALPARLSPGLGLVLCDAGDASLAAVQAGRALERVWLAATVEGLALQPLAAATALARQRSGDGWVSPQVQSQLREALSELTQGHPERAFMFVRVGHAKPARVVAGRPLLEAFLA